MSSMTARNFNFLFRVDADSIMGTGHLMRCLALAQTLKEYGGQATFLTNTDSTPLLGRLRDEGLRVAAAEGLPGSADDARMTAAYAARGNLPWVVIDGYHFGPEFQRGLRSQGLFTLVIDDNGIHAHCDADLVLNQNLHASERMYPDRAPHTQLLLGTKYVLLRNEFRQWRGRESETNKTAKRILVTIGGSDPDNVTLKVIRALKETTIAELKVKVVAGAANPHFASLKQEIKNTGNDFELLGAVTNMPELMAWADLAVAAAGTTSWELAFMGLPMLAVIIADNQVQIAEPLSQCGAAVNAGWGNLVEIAALSEMIKSLLTSPSQRSEMAAKGSLLVDGEGADRVVMQMLDAEFRLRPVRKEDSRLIWEWANMPDVRAVSFSAEPIPWENHLNWFEAKLDDPGCFFQVAVNREDLPVGQIRFDHNFDEAVVSISLDPGFRGKGYGTTLLRLGAQKLFNLTEVGKVNAYIKPDNQTSVHAFTKAGYKAAGAEMIRGQKALHFVLRRHVDERLH